MIYTTINKQKKKRFTDYRLQINTNIHLTSYSDDDKSTDSSPNVITPPAFRKRLSIIDIIGNYFTSSEGKILFICKNDKTVYNCLSHRIDIFDSIVNKKMDISLFVNKANKKNCELTSQQTIMIYNQIQYLKYSYLIMLKKESRDSNLTYSECCKKAIEHMSQYCGVNLINKYRIFTKWNRIFCLDEVFPHPNYNIQLGYTYHSNFLDAFPETEILI